MTIKKLIKNYFNQFIDMIINHIAKEKIYVLGDSHVLVFKHPYFKLNFPFKNFEICSVMGATASGLYNPQSKTQAYPIFKEKIRSISKGKKIIIMLGEVDTGFIIWYRANKKRIHRKNVK